MSGFSCRVHGCSYEDDALCAKDGVKMYLVEGHPTTLVCEPCLSNVGCGLPLRPFFDWATDRAGNWDGYIPGAGWIENISFSELAVNARKAKTVIYGSDGMWSLHPKYYPDYPE
jgi:hypothetical protein